MKTNIILIFKIISLATFCAYTAFLTLYFTLRLLFWDKLALVGFISNFIPWILLPIFTLPIISLSLRNRFFFIISCLAVLILLGWVHAKYFSPKAFDIGNVSPSITVLSMNVGQHLVEPKFLNSFILEKDADVVFLQEVTNEYIKNGWSDLIKTYPYQVHGPLLSERQVGMGILSRYPILSSKDFKLADEGLVFQQRATLQIDKREIVAYNIHTTYPWFRPQKIFFSFILPMYDYSTRSSEIQTLVKLLQDEQLPVIAAGDFNMTDQAQDYSYLTQILIDSFQESGWGFGFTWPAHKNPNGEINLNNPIVRIDYIMHSDDWISQATQVLSKTGSDHLPIITKLFLKATEHNKVSKNE
ncbi:endonuclease/exonuclease/phosphatase family protein [Aerosakkonemataceae cyanobacterium BLCC-F154]|uniref:Endonuclease/exonuclease/phosphatase family protein n=1 Tax=Floridaenema fluviatile BLCC-F154 TaxID=3153640 RepID=A0ABV4YG00_9CYAN